MAFPKEGDYSTFYKRYIDLVEVDNVADVIKTYSKPVSDFYNNLPEDKAAYAYADGKWTLKQLLQHIIDAERIFSYRALRISRGDTTPLPGFDENTYAYNATAANRALGNLKEEFNAVRLSSDLLLQSFTPEQLQQQGTASNAPITVNAICFILYGHLLHHKNIIQQRYL